MIYTLGKTENYDKWLAERPVHKHVDGTVYQWLSEAQKQLTEGFSIYLVDESRNLLILRKIETRIVNIKNKSPYDIYIGRPRYWEAWGFGNPFVVGRDGLRGECIPKFSRWLETGDSQGSKEATLERREWILDNLHSLKNKTLGCFCYPSFCHGDVLAKMCESR